MKKYKVYSSQLVYYVTEVEAESEEQAEEIAFNRSDNWDWFDTVDFQIEKTEEIK